MSYEPASCWRSTARCFMCRRVHSVERWATIVLVSQIAQIPIDVHLCSQDCEDNLLMDYKMEIDPVRRALAVSEMLRGE